MPGTNTEAATKARLAGAVPVSVLSRELKEFMSKYGLERKDLPEILDLPDGTIGSILYSKRRPTAESGTAAKIRKGIRDYNPRTCKLRKLKSSEVFPVLKRLRKENGLSITEFTEIIGIPRWKYYRLQNGRTPMVPAEEVRIMIANFNDWKRMQEQQWQRDAFAVQLTKPAKGA